MRIDETYKGYSIQWKHGASVSGANIWAPGATLALIDTCKTPRADGEQALKAKAYAAIDADIAARAKG